MLYRLYSGKRKQENISQQYLLFPYDWFVFVIKLSGLEVDMDKP